MKIHTLVARCWLLGLICSLAPIGRVQAEPTETSADAQFERLANAWWGATMAANPLYATATGDHRWNDRLPIVSLDQAAKQHEADLAWGRQLAALPRASLKPANQLNAALMQRSIDWSLGEYEHGGYLMPITNREGFHVSFPDLRNDMPFRTEADYRNYIARLQAFDDYVVGHVELMREGLRRGLTLPAAVLSRYREPLEVHLNPDVEKTLFYEPLLRIPASFSVEVQTQLRQAGRIAISTGVQAGYRRFLEFLEKEYVPGARTTLAASAMSGGRTFYQHRIRYFTTLDLSAEAVHATGLNEVARIERDMQAIMRQVEFSGTVAEYVASLRTNPAYYAQDARQLVAEASRICKRIDGKLPLLFRTLPRTPYGIQPIPDYIAPQTTSAYYMPPAGDGSRAGFFYLNTYDLSSRPLFNLTALALHEAVPGHHLQIALQQELSDVPPYRRFSDVTAYVEGWALYSERLGVELGLYETPVDDFGRLTFEMWRACRLVVDTGIHHLGWTREQAIEFLSQRTALALHDIRAEVDRYIAWPGQALAYKIGELKIRELRQRAEERLGTRFDVREFHHAILHEGPLPLDLLDHQIERWIDQVNSAVPRQIP